MEGNSDSFRPQEHTTDGNVASGNEAPTGAQLGGQTAAPQFSNSFSPDQGVAPEEPSSPTTRQRSGSKDYSHTDEWDASKVPPSRFQQRKGSIYSTPASRDGHVEKNKDRDNTFHKTHGGMFDKAKEKAKEALGSSSSGHRRKSSAGSGGE